MSPNEKVRQTNSLPSGIAHVGDITTRKESASLERDPAQSDTLEITSAVFGDGACAITGCNDRSARVRETASGQELLVLEGADFVTAGAFTSDETRVATA
jgi:hypothetical protein